jgi:tRNA modification GTPase
MNDTIAAIASGMTASGIGIIRISGPEAFAVLEAIFRPRKKDDRVADWSANTIHYGHITDGEEVIDECLVMAMKAPHTYTTEDTIEIDCHGGPYVMRKVLQSVLAHGARTAEPGEFTKRAFLGGRIDLAEAEAVMDLISSRNDNALRSSLMQLSGSVTNAVKAIRSSIMDELAFIEAALDDPEHMDLTGYPEELLAHLVPIEERLTALLRTYRDGKRIREGLLTVILGKPNAGKSSLLNVMTGEDRAIVTDIEGTTRDVLEEIVNIGEVTLRVLDTAGIRNARDEIEQIGIRRAKEYAGEADLILMVIDSARPLDDNDREILDLIRGRKAIILLNKSDLESVIDEEDIRSFGDVPVISVSARENRGIGELEKTIREMFFSGALRFNEEAVITNIRHKEAMESALQSLGLVRNSIHDGMPEDFYSIDLMDAYTILGSIIGEEVDDDLVDTIFAKFCMGK